MRSLPTDSGSIFEERRALLRFAKHLCRSAPDADDLVQDTLLRLWRHQPEFPSEGHRRAWLKRVLLNGHIDRRRRDKRALEWVAREAASDPEPISNLSAPVTQVSPAMQRSLDALPADYRRVLLLVDVCEQSYQEAAEQLACPIGTIMSRLHRARRQLRERVEREPDVTSREPGLQHGLEQASVAAA